VEDFLSSFFRGVGCGGAAASICDVGLVAHFKEHHDVLMRCKLQFSNVAMLSSKQKAQVASSLTPKRRLKVCRDRIGATNV